MDRAYTVAEIDALRSAIKNRILWGTSDLSSFTGSRSSGSFSRGELEGKVEDQIRTYMVAGVTAADILAEDRARTASYQAAFPSAAKAP